MAKFKNIKGSLGSFAIAPEPAPLSKPRLTRQQQTVKKVFPLASPVTVPKTSVSGSKRQTTRPQMVGTFALILLATVVLQIVLLVSLLYLSPKLIH